MDIIHTLIDYLVHFEAHLDYVIINYHSWTYLVLFLIIFIETGFIIMPFLPGDSLLFVVGAIVARGPVDFWSISGTLLLAAILGDNVNYTVGKLLGPKIFSKENHKLFNIKHLDKAQGFYAKYGSKTIILARFVPIVRSFAPFVAGIGKMPYRKFLSYSVIGGTLWIISFISLGFFFGNLPMVKNNFELVVLAIVGISIVPGLLEYIRENRKSV
jgi:membrane-associated protein